jgi:predicted ATPase/DNA-binding CsgD family transcriptional regulator
VSLGKGGLLRDGRTNLPPDDVTPFVDRQRELAELMQLQHDTRLLSLLGPAGVGKTRLARRLGQRVLRQFPQGVWLVELPAGTDGKLLPARIARILDIPERGRGETLVVLEAALASSQMLLVLDGCEQVVDDVAVVVEQLLHGCPGLSFLATSRKRLGLDGELPWRVPPLATPSAGHAYRPGELARVDSVALFVERARRVNAGFAIVESNVEPVGELVRRLDGLPLAVELAATWMEAVSPVELVGELDDRYQILVGRRVVTDRHPSLWTAVQSSYERLDPDARSLFRQVGMFAGGWNLGAMTAVCRLESGRALEVLGRLVDHSLVTVVPTSEGPTRYRLLEVLRRYALDTLEASGQHEDVQRRFVGHFVALAETASPNLPGREGPRWLAAMDAELDNMRAVLAMEQEWTAEARLRLAVAMVPYWHFRGLVNEGREHLRGLVRTMAPAAPAAAAAQNGLSWLSWSVGDLGVAASCARAGYRCARAAGDRAEEAYALLRLAQAQYDLGRPTAGPTARRAERIAADLGDQRLLAECHLQLGYVALAEAHLEEAERLLREGARLFSLAERVDREAVALLVLGRVLLRRDRARDAEDVLRRSLTILRGFAMVRYSIPVLETLAAVAAWVREYARSATLVGAAAGLLERIGARPPATAPMRVALAQVWAPALRAPGAEKALAAGRAMDLAEAIAFALRESGPAARPRRQPGVVREALTPRQLEIARCIGKDMNTREIARQLGISERTVEGHVDAIFDRLGFDRRPQIANWIREHDA